MTNSLYCLSVINDVGNMLAGFSASGTGGWSHFQTSVGAEPPTAGFIEIDTVATRQAVSVSSYSDNDGQVVMAFLGHSDNKIYFAASGDGSTWPEHQFTGFNSNVPPAIFVMPYNPRLLLTYIEPQDNEIIVASSADGGATWHASRTGQTSKSAPAIFYTADVAGGSFSSTNFYYLMLFQSNDSNNNILAATSSDAVSWQLAPGTGQQSPAAPSIAPGIPSDGGTNFTMAFLSNDPTNRILLSSSVGGVSWGSATDTGHHCRGTPQLVNIDGILFLVYLGLNDNHIYCCRSADGKNWSETQVCPGLYAPGACRFSAQPAPTLTSPVTVTREGGLGDANNYYFYDGGRPLRNVSVEIVVTEDIPMPAATTAGSGISFQVNCYSPANTQPDWKNLITGWQQYDTHVATNASNQTNLFDRIDIWPQQPLPGFPKSLILNLTSSNTALPQASILKKSRFVTTLHNDTDDNVTGATFTAYDPSGNVIKTWSPVLVGQTTAEKTALTQQEIAPIIAFQVDLVASNGKVTLTGGAGTITCSAWNMMTVVGSKPPNAVGPPTGENANSLYGTLTNLPSTVFTQTFKVS